MHNLSGVFFQEGEIQEFDGKKYFSFVIVYPLKKRYYYIDNKEDYSKWVEVMKIATGYSSLIDLYDIKGKLGNGKFGLVKLGVSKKTGEKVAVK